MATKVISTARVRLVLDIQLSDTWGSECTVEQIHKQAKDGVLSMLQQRHVPPELVRAQIIGEPEVTAILVERN